MLNLSSLSTQSLASCVNYFVWNCLTCFSNTKIGSVTSFSILFNFQGPVRLSQSADSLLILPPKRQIVKHFFEDFLKFLGEPIDLRTFPVAFSEVFVSDVRLTVMYFSTDPLKKQVLFSLFLNYFAVRPFAQFFLSDLAALSIIRPTACPASPLISCAPAVRSVPAWYGAVLPYRSGSCPHRNAAG